MGQTVNHCCAGDESSLAQRPETHFNQQMFIQTDQIRQKLKTVSRFKDSAHSHFNLSSPLKEPNSAFMRKQKLIGAAQISTGKWKAYLSDSQSSSSAQHMKGILHTQQIDELYHIGNVLGEGKFGVVRIVEKKNYNRIRFAMKEMLVDPDCEEFQQREFDIIKTLDHPFTMNLVEVYFSQREQKLQLVLPLYEGGDVYSLIQAKGTECIPEKDVARIIYQLLRALAYLHTNNITHRDLKPENIVFESKKTGSTSIVRLIDFGFALDLNQTIDDSLIFMGTPYYMAPEVVRKQSVGPKADMWSLGVCMYVMLVGYPPFIKAKTQQELFDLINTCNYDYNDQDWSKISSSARSLIDALIQPSIQKRLSAEQALQHPWILNNIKQPKVNPGLLKQLANLKDKSKLQHFNLLILSELLSISDLDFVDMARENFLAVDQSAHGEITKDDLSKALLQVNPMMQQEQIDRVFQKLDCDGNGSISYSEWLCALVFCDHMTTKNIQNLFRFLDVNKKGVMSVQDLERAYTPHIFRLKLEFGKEEEALHNLVMELRMQANCDFDGPMQSPSELTIDLELFQTMMGQKSRRTRPFEKLDAPKKQRSSSTNLPRFVQF